MANEKIYIAPQSCEHCPDAPAGASCESRYNCALYVGVKFNADRIAEQASEYDPRSEWERDVEELYLLMEAS